MDEGSDDRSDDDHQADGRGPEGPACPERPAGRRSCHGRLMHAASEASVVLPARIWFSVRRRYAGTRSMEGVRVLIVEDEPYMAEAVRDGLRLEAIAADIAGDGDTALELLSVNTYDIAVLDRDIPGPTG